MDAATRTRAEMNATTPLDPAAAGWFVTPRALLASSVMESLSCEGWRVAILVLLVLPRFRDEEHWFGPHRFTVKRGELFHSEEEIARLAHVSRKVTRTVLRRLEGARLMERRRVHPSGQCPHVITVLDYELSQTLPTEGARDRANGRAIDRADEGPETGQRGALSKPQVTEEEPQGNLIQPQEPLPSPPAPAARQERKGSASKADPRHGAWKEIAKHLFAELRPGARFDFNGHDGKELHDFLERQPDATAEEWRSVYGRALELGSKYPGTAKVAQALQRWNELIATPNAPRASGAPLPAMTAGFGETGGF